MVERRFLVAPSALKEDPEARVGLAALIQGDEHHHLSHVLRLKIGDAVSVFDGVGQGFKGTIESIGRDQTRVLLSAPDNRSVEPVFRLTLAQGIPHHDKMDFVIQKTTEIGVARIVPVLAARSVIRPSRDGEWKRLERWRRIAREAARQSGRLSVPEVTEPCTWKELTDLKDGCSDTMRFILDAGSEDARRISEIRMAEPGRSAMVAVGPEGGWTEAEIGLARERRFRPVRFGPRVMRSETAGIVSVALLLFLAGELDPARGRPSPP